MCMNKQLAISLICNFIVSLKMVFVLYWTTSESQTKSQPNQECIAIGSLAHGLIEEVISCNFLTKYIYIIFLPRLQLNNKIRKKIL